MLPVLTHSLFSHFAVSCNSQGTSFFGLEPWYQYLQMQPDAAGACQVTNFQLLGPNSSILLILIAIIDDLLRIAGLAAVLFVIYSGIKYITSTGSPDKTGEAMSSLVNSLIGLAISLIAIQAVAYLGAVLAKAAPNGNTNAGGVDASVLPSVTANANFVQQGILPIIFGIAGALSFAFLVYGGFRYVLSQGDPQAISKAKGTILYALIGVIIALLGSAIVTFVIHFVTHP